MKLSLLLPLTLSALSSVSLQGVQSDTRQGNASLRNSLPLLTVAKLRERRQVQSSTFVSDGGSTLEWVTWNNSLPNDAVSIYNAYVDRIDYVCKHTCAAGFYTPSKGPYCHYVTEGKAYSGSPFEILVNKDNFEMLEWKEDSYGSVPPNSIRTCPGENVFVGKNKYGLGKVSAPDKAFYLPWDGSEYWYNYYQVLTNDEDISSQKIYDVKYNTDDSSIFHFPPEVMRETAISNHECRSVLKRDELSKTYQVEQRWDFTSSIALRVETSISAEIPLISSVGIQFSTEVMLQFTRGSTVQDTVTDSMSVEFTAPPNHSCVVKMVRYKYKVNIPFTARLSRTYADGEVRSTSIAGTYDSVQVGEVQAVVDRCQALDNSKACT
ncbi:Natterin-4 [Channa argus]|uniref:Natterin-4 n=1 Tax=Channa argus TaxID=215402 RepID=A0A6G1PYT2_CHAAH|nr:Natterin-4 [Channa argus]KAK2901685.1 hypothetical protein Q8A73_011431 [Channa argus]